jgi:hypothetical protein
MKTGFAMLVGAGVLSLAVGVGSATADVRHHHRHMARSHAVQQAPAAARADYATFEDNHNPAKKYPTRQISENAVKTGTLQQNGNNPAKRYTTQHPIENAMKTGTLPQNGNNPAKRYKSTASTTGAAPR